MIPRFNDSPSMRKLLRNRGAVIAMTVIGVYLLVFAWILLMQGVAWVGNQTKAFDLAERPVLGALLPERTLERVGPRNLSGFGIESSNDLRFEQMSFYFERAGDAIRGLERIPSDASPEQIQIERDRVAQSARLSERMVLDAPLEQLKEIQARGRAAFTEQASLRTLRGNLLRLEIAIDTVRENLVLLDNPPEGSSQGDLLDELSLSIEEIGFLIEDVQGDAAEGSALAQLDSEQFFDAGMGVLDDPRPEPVLDPELLASAWSAADERLAELDAEINTGLNAIEPIIEELYPMPTGIRGALYKLRLMLGTDRQGRSILIRAVYSAKVAIQVGIVVSVIAVAFGSLIGAAAGYFGSWVDHLVIWLYSTFSSIPYLVLLVVLAFMFTGSRVEGTLIPLYTAFCLTYWIGPCRVTRGETLKLKSLDYVQAANALGASKGRILVKHIIPNTAHLMFINLSLLFIGAIKGEVVLTFLGLGLKDGASWGIMIDQSKSEVISGFFWQIGAATFFMFVLVLAFNVFTDALQDAFDPKHVG